MYQWKDIGAYVLQEVLCRNVMWVIKAHSNWLSMHKNTATQQQLYLDTFYKGCAVSLRLIMFHVYFLKHFAPQPGETLDQIANRYDETYGQATEDMKEQFQKAVFQIMNAKTLQEFFAKCYFTVGPSYGVLQTLIAIIENAVLRSQNLGYH